MLESNVMPMRRRKQNQQMGSVWTDFRNSVEDKIVGSAGNLFPSTQAVPPTQPAIARAPVTIAGLSMTTMGILGIGTLVVWKLLTRKK